ncbi:hypothetical protein PIIN_00861 [Serendipita indica DSM 11827]|uniref:Uncharacterized protein n=1 Tax=Serendipita indica (strain DSM 11827) TaxID=1109443 RepID=G4T6Q9_SERID|nr:hypothetical protein PIIN_00861 [Serendipita indica DSM 11827]
MPIPSTEQSPMSLSVSVFPASQRATATPKLQQQKNGYSLAQLEPISQSVSHSLHSPKYSLRLPYLKLSNTLSSSVAVGINRVTLTKRKTTTSTDGHRAYDRVGHSFESPRSLSANGTIMKKKGHGAWRQKEFRNDAKGCNEGRC